MSHTWTNMRTSSSACIGPTNMRTLDKWSVYSYHDLFGRVSISVPHICISTHCIISNCHRNLQVIFTMGADYVGKSRSWKSVLEEVTSRQDILLLNIRDQYDLVVLKGLYTLLWIQNNLPQVQIYQV